MVALGSNVGDRMSHMEHGVARLRAVLSDVVVSSFIETVPEDAADGPLFLNGALVGTTSETPERLLATLLRIEQERGRERHHPGAPRTLDLDLVLVGELTIDSSDLRLPHPRFRSRAFVLGPLADIAPDLIDPVTGKSILELFEGLGRTVGGGVSMPRHVTRPSGGPE